MGERVGSRVGSSVEHVSAEEAVLIAESVVNSRCQEVFVRYPVTSEEEFSDVGVSFRGAVWNREQREVAQDIFIYALIRLPGHHQCLCERARCHRRLTVVENSIAGVYARHRVRDRSAFSLANTFVVRKEEGVILDEWSPDCPAKLVAPE